MADAAVDARPSIRANDSNPAPANMPSAEPEQRSESTELDLSDLKNECRAQDMPAAGTRSACALYRAGLIGGHPELEGVMRLMNASPREQLINVEGVGPAGYEALNELVAEFDLVGEQEKPDEETGHIRPVPRSYSNNEAPVCPECGSGMIVNGTNRDASHDHPQESIVMRYWKCKAEPDNEDHRTKTISRERR